ncbi:MAG: outer membrane protein assembly factor BamD [Candidatus Omnitrophota bacterium]
MKFQLKILFILLISLLVWENDSQAFWVWTPKTNQAVNPKFAVKDTPDEQFDWAMRFFKKYEFSRAADEFIRLVESYPDSDLAPEAQYYAGRSYEEIGKYLYAFENYQKTLEKYPYTKRMEEILEREYNIANIFQNKETSKLMEMELSLSLERAGDIYEKVVENSPFGEYADKSLFEAAGCYRRMLNYKKAIETYERIVNDYPESKLGIEAKYQLAYTRYESSLGPEYDQESTDEAIKEFKDISNNTAVPSIAKEATTVYDELTAKKADSEVKIAEFYEKKGKYQSALFYYEGVVSNFAGTPAAEIAQGKVEQLNEKVKK